MSAWPLESDATVAVAAAARKLFDIGRAEIQATLRPDASSSLSTWEEIGPVGQLQFREAVLPTVWAALEALPDPRRSAWTEGHVAGREDERLDYEEPTENPYPQAEEAL